MDRRVVCAAIRNSKGDIICAPRHFDGVMRAHIAANGQHWGRAEQGFVDQFGVWMSREEAYTVAFDAGQIIRRCGNDEGCLYSENLY